MDIAKAEQTALLDGRATLLPSRFWATNTLIVEADSGCLVTDPCIFPDELDEIRARVDAYDGACVLITHAHFDHACGIPWFPAATIVAGERTAALIADGTVRGKLDEWGPQWGADWSGEVRVDQVIEGTASCGGLAVTAVDVHGHAPDGSAFIVDELGLMVPGDYLSSVSYPLVLSSLPDTIAAQERLLEALDAHPIEVVVPGHGPALSDDEARQVGREDLEYLRALRGAAEEAVSAGAATYPAYMAVYEVEPPREERPDFDPFGHRATNARKAVAEAQAQAA
ncbi:MAG: MBL fold metallo-hydrolase [Solirubrobacterales bacterium]